MQVASKINEYLKELHLPTIRACFADVASEARAESLSFEEYLLELIGQECTLELTHFR